MINTTDFVPKEETINHISPSTVIGGAGGADYAMAVYGDGNSQHAVPGQGNFIDMKVAPCHEGGSRGKLEDLKQKLEELKSRGGEKEKKQIEQLEKKLEKIQEGGSAKKQKQLQKQFQDKLGKIQRDGGKVQQKLQKEIEYLQLTPAKRKKIDEQNTINQVENTKDGGSF